MTDPPQKTDDLLGVRLHARASTFEFAGISHDLIDIDDLIAVKEHVGRPKDLVAAAQLRAIRSRLPPR